VIRPRADGDSCRRVHWLHIAHAQRDHRHYRTSGHVWQGRFIAFPIQDDDRLRTVLRSGSALITDLQGQKGFRTQT